MTKKEMKNKMSFINYNNIFSLEEFSFIAGTEYLLEYTVFQEDGVNKEDISSAQAIFYLFPYGQPDYVVLQKTCTIGVALGTFSVTLESNDTKNLSGTYIQQPLIVDFYGKQYRLGQGRIIISPRANND